MRRFGTIYKQLCCRQSSSYAAGLFNFKIVPAEMFPYPIRKLDGEEAENLQSVLETLRNGGNILTSLYGARIAAEYGGLGLGYTAHGLIYDELGAKCEEKLLSTIRHGGVCTHLLETVGAKDVKGKYLTAMSDGSVIMGWAVEEDVFGSDISMNTTKAVHHDDSGYKLSGKKRSLDVASATHFLVLAKTLTQTSTVDGAAVTHRSSLFVCSKDAPGIKIEGNTLILDNTPASDFVGVVGEGFKDVMITLFSEQYLYAVSLLGTMRRIVEELQGINEEKVIEDIVPSCICAIYAMESAVYALTANMDVPTEDSLLECTLVCAFVQSTVSTLIQKLEILTLPNKVLDKCFDHAKKSLALMESRDFLYATASCCGVEDYGLFFQKASTLQMMQARTLRLLGMRDRVPLKGVPEISLIEEAVVKFGDAVEATFVKNGSQVPYQQLLLNRLGEAASLLYAASAVASRASMCTQKGLPSAKAEGQLAACFIRFSVQRVNTLSEECCNIGKTADDVYKRIALEICEDALQ
ncbi:putative acyl-CoA dehydrogenase, mitochondrial precursor [Trypanosoma theileri]|uniref:Putative acyl-CoA dehydrogenase, mitochondrial n=1 Tax=Trypanosoma theileri TaxID=67003 RepID=A0A1X0NP97_9TRYP|nr:putative acyl-CoA dehydrogenase, mitochondrial precursor [Trypanosoma theileri]ORC86536.1 putative acyl-CoA dehydrogenase, mitochondrial precursor [Trypanosoma theileri]